MSRLFDMDNPVWKVMGRVADIFFLTLLWFVCCLPIVTIGASTTAMYYMSLKMAGNKEGYLLKSFAKSFKENLGISTAVWMVLAAVLCILGADFYLVTHMEARQASFFFWGFAVAAVLYFLVFTIVFPLAARLKAGVLKLFFLAFMTAVKNFSWVFLMAVVTLCVIAMGIFVFWPILLLAPGGIAYVHGIILEHMIFPKYNWNEE